MRPSQVTGIEVLEDLSAKSRLDEGYLRLKRLRCRNLHADGTTSREYKVDVIHRPTLDAVAVLVYRRGPRGLEFLTRTTLRPAAYFRKDIPGGAPTPDAFLFVEEIVAGVLEMGELSAAGVRQRAAEEVHEESGYSVSESEVQVLGEPPFVAAGVLSERIYMTACDVTGKPQAPPPGDGSPLEEGGQLFWRSGPELLAACRAGVVPDVKAEIALTRFLARQTA
ncbi:MAG: NUDIX hydrolase [Myxococcaceae bacterium]